MTSLPLGTIFTIVKICLQLANAFVAWVHEKVLTAKIKTVLDAQQIQELEKMRQLISATDARLATLSDPEVIESLRRNGGLYE